jgi:hypothetical protein
VTDIDLLELSLPRHSLKKQTSLISQEQFNLKLEPLS